MGTIRAAVIGAGYLGRFHAQKLAASPLCELVAVVDSDKARAHAVARETGAQPYTDYRQICGAIDAASVVVPTAAHHKVARDLIRAGVNVLLEKPMTETLRQADALIRMARSRNVILQVGHLERFNPASVKLHEIASRPRFIEAHRLAPFKPRGTDVDVVLDLMIHDIDLILGLVQSPVRRIEASGTAVLSASADIANARLTFADGCVANVTASRISLKTERKLRVFQSDTYVSADLQNRRLTVCRRQAGGDSPQITLDQVEAEGDALEAEVAAFLQAVSNGSAPAVSGVDGRRALAAALQISRLIAATQPPGTSATEPDSHVRLSVR
jgi:predicted dehydrogenase